MAITVGDVILAARDRHSLFAKPNVPDAVFVRYFTDYQRTLLSKAIQRDSTFLMSGQTVSNPDPATPVTLPANKRLVGGTVNFANDQPSIELTIVSYSDRLDSLGPYTATLEGLTLTFHDYASDWSGVSNVTLDYVAEPGALTALTDTFVLPDTSRPTLVANGALMAGQRLSGMQGMPQIDLSGLAMAASEAEKAWLSEVGSARRSRVHRIREVW